MNQSVHNIKPKRSFNGERWKTNTSNKKRLVSDFYSRCGYCGDIHSYSGGFNSYHVEHFAPKDKFSTHQFIYDNLIYACPFCNIAKSNTWIGNSPKENIVKNKGFIDPCHNDYDKHLYRKPLGQIGYKTPVGEYMYYTLKLYLKRHEIIFSLNRIDDYCTKIKEKIDQLKIEGKSTSQYEELLRDLTYEFYFYHKSFVGEQESY